MLLSATWTRFDADRHHQRGAICLAVLNYIRVIKRAWDPLIYIGIFIAFTRVFFHYATCKDSIGTRRNYAWVMFLTTCLEGGMLFWQVSSMLANSS